MQTLSAATPRRLPTAPPPAAAVRARPPSWGSRRPLLSDRSGLGSAVVPTARRLPVAASAYTDDELDIIIMPAVGILYDDNGESIRDDGNTAHFLKERCEGVWFLTCNSRVLVRNAMKMAGISNSGWLKLMPALSAEQRIEALWLLRFFKMQAIQMIRKIVEHSSMECRNPTMHFASSDVDDLLNAWVAPKLENVYLYLKVKDGYHCLEEDELKQLLAWDRFDDVSPPSFLPSDWAYGLKDHLF